MCAFDELVRVEPPPPPLTVKEVRSTSTELGDHRPADRAVQGDLWLGSDDELFATLAASDPELLCSPREPELFCSTSSTSVSTLAINVAQPDDGFLAHLLSISNSTAVPTTRLEGQQHPAENSTIVVLSPGKKRVLPPPNNNPFKRKKLMDVTLGCSYKANFLFSSELDGQLFSGTSKILEEANTSKVNTSKVPHRAASQERSQYSHTRKGAHISAAAGDFVNFDAGGDQGSGVMEMGISQGSMQSHLPTLPSLHAQDLKDLEDSVGKAGRNQVLIGADTATGTLCSVEAEGLEIKSWQQQNSEAELCVRPDLQVSTSQVHQGSMGDRYFLEICDVSTSHDNLPASAYHCLQSAKAGTDTLKTPIVPKQQQRESKMKKEIKSSSKQSSRVVVAASTHSLFKFFQRTPTL